MNETLRWVAHHGNPPPYGKPPLHGHQDPDIGMCDDCGTTDGPRLRTIVPARIDGAPARVVAWLCGSCRRERAAS